MKQQSVMVIVTGPLAVTEYTSSDQLVFWLTVHPVMPPGQAVPYSGVATRTPGTATGMMPSELGDPPFVDARAGTIKALATSRDTTPRDIARTALRYTFGQVLAT